jgi:hypothetical protein
MNTLTFRTKRVVRVSVLAGLAAAITVAAALLYWRLSPDGEAVATYRATPPPVSASERAPSSQQDDGGTQQARAAIDSVLDRRDSHGADQLGLLYDPSLRQHLEPGRHDQRPAGRLFRERNDKQGKP